MQMIRLFSVSPSGFPNRSAWHDATAGKPIREKGEKEQL